MLEPGPGLDPSRHWQLTSLLEDVMAARRLLDLARHDKRHGEPQQLRRDLLVTLEAYADALTLAGAPLPPRLRSEINLYKGLGAWG